MHDPLDASWGLAPFLLGTLQIYIFTTANRLWAPSAKPLPPKSFISHTCCWPCPSLTENLQSASCPPPPPPPKTWLPEKFYFQANQTAVVERSQPIKSLHARRLPPGSWQPIPSDSLSLRPQIITAEHKERERKLTPSSLSFWPHFLFPVFLDTTRWIRRFVACE